jgi:hypothetical protein
MRNAYVSLLAKLFFASFIVIVMSPAKSLAWGYEAHRIIGEIAEQFLDPHTAHQVRDLLAIKRHYPC